MNDNDRVVVLGAGYAGLMAVICLARRTDAHITLVNPSARFTERLRMHQLAAGQELADHRIPDLLSGTGVDFVLGAATAIDPDARAVQVDGGQALGYDKLVYAIGGVTDTSRVPGADTHAFTLDSPQGATRFAARLGEIARTGGTVTVCGAGLTGVEAAAEIAEAYPGLHVTVVSLDEPGAGMNAKARAYLHGALDRLGVTVRAGVRATKVLSDAVELATGEVVPADACLWTAGVRAAPLAAAAGMAVDDLGRVVVDAALRSVSHPDIHAVGDAAAVQLAWGRLHGTCQSGVPSGQYTADTIAALLRGEPVRPFRFGYVHRTVSLGRRDGVIQFTHADDSPRRGYLTGRLAALYKEAILANLLGVYRLSKRVHLPVTLSKGERVPA